jgi:hypothetical protein
MEVDAARMSGVGMPRETMLMTSVSASTAQIELIFSGVSADFDSGPFLDRDAEVARDVLRNGERRTGWSSCTQAPCRVRRRRWRGR